MTEAVNDQQTNDQQDSQDAVADITTIFEPDDSGDGDGDGDSSGGNDDQQGDSTEKGRSGDDAPDSDSKTEGDAEDTKDGDGEDDQAQTDEELTFRPESGYEKFAYGEEVPIDKPLEDAFTKFAATLNSGKGLSQKDAQSLIDFYQQEVFGALDRAGQAQRPIWKEESNADPTYGGAKYAKSTEDIEAFLTLCDNQAIADNYQPRQGLRAWLEASGWIDYAPLRAALAFAGENMTREPSGPIGERRQSRRKELDLSRSRDLGEALFGDDEDDEG